MLLIKIIGEETDGGTGAHPSDHQHGRTTRPQWMRVIAMEIMRGCVFVLNISRVAFSLLIFSFFAE